MEEYQSFIIAEHRDKNSFVLNYRLGYKIAT